MRLDPLWMVTWETAGRDRVPTVDARVLLVMVVVVGFWLVLLKVRSLLPEIVEFWMVMVSRPREIGAARFELSSVRELLRIVRLVPAKVDTLFGSISSSLVRPPETDVTPSKRMLKADPFVFGCSSRLPSNVVFLKL